MTSSCFFQIWRCAPIAKGVGFAMIVLSLIVSIYYNVIMAYSIIYIGASFVGTYDELPWTYCGTAKAPSFNFKFCLLVMVSYKGQFGVLIRQPKCCGNSVFSD